MKLIKNKSHKGISIKKPRYDFYTLVIRDLSVHILLRNQYL